MDQLLHYADGISPLLPKPTHFHLKRGLDVPDERKCAVATASDRLLDPTRDGASLISLRAHAVRRRRRFHTIAKGLPGKGFSPGPNSSISECLR